MTAPENALVWCELRELFGYAQAHEWMITPHPMFDGRCPHDCSFDEVMRVIDQLKSGAFI